jgi:hypothetical protein
MVQAANCRSFSSEDANLAASVGWNKRSAVPASGIAFCRNCAALVPAYVEIDTDSKPLGSILVLFAGVGVEGAEAGFDGLADDSVFDFFFQLRDGFVDRHHAEVRTAGV